MPWWGWMVVGALLLGAELFVVEAEFFLVFIAVSALLTGVLALLAPDLPLWTHWLSFAVLAVASMVFFRKRVYAAIRPNIPGLKDDFVGDEVRVGQALAVGDTGRLELRGTTWQVRNDGRSAIPAGGKARIVAVDGVMLRVKPLDD